jgi:aryl-alcohol dehydrogenase-like predicted oxidoreductase
MLGERSLGPLRTSSIGLGCMGMSGFYGPPDPEEAARTIEAAVDGGVTLFDTADRYGLGKNEELVGKALQGRDALVATKFGIVPGSERGTRDLDGSPAYVRRACEASLVRLGRSTIDLLYLHRVDSKVPVEDTVGAMGRLVEEGKVRFLGLSEVSDATLRRAHATWPIAAVQSEYSLWCREAERAVLPTCKELGVGFVAYGALGLGMFSGGFMAPSQFFPNDYRPTTPRFQGENFVANLRLVRSVVALASEVGCTPAQLALAWILIRQPAMVPLVGTKRRAHLAENLVADTLAVPPRILDLLDQLFPVGVAAGDRYGVDGMRWLNG